ncbi:hypothetical protein [Paraburkholderia sp. BL10I2N1]|nr:hypothetical protein [Paraburkholderia sp. BL10I2N1]
MTGLSVLCLAVSGSNILFAAGLRLFMPHRPEHLTDQSSNDP